MDLPASPQALRVPGGGDTDFTHGDTPRVFTVAGIQQALNSAHGRKTLKAFLTVFQQLSCGLAGWDAHPPPGPQGSVVPGDPRAAPPPPCEHPERTLRGSWPLAVLTGPFHSLSFVTGSGLHESFLHTNNFFTQHASGSFWEPARARCEAQPPPSKPTPAQLKGSILQGRSKVPQGGGGTISDPVLGRLLSAPQISVLEGCAKSLTDGTGGQDSPTPQRDRQGEPGSLRRRWVPWGGGSHPLGCGPRSFILHVGKTLPQTM